jgi:glycerol kinase
MDAPIVPEPTMQCIPAAEARGIARLRRLGYDAAMPDYLLALDQGTTSSRAILFDASGAPRASHQVELPQIYPRPGWVEHDPELIWSTQLAAARGAMERAGASTRQLAALGIANQRETVVAWERDTLRPLHNAVVWQCRRTAPECEELRRRGLEELLARKTGLVVDPYFSATKIAWLLEHVDGLRERARRGEVCFGTVDSWLVARLAGVHLTDPSNASRTMLYDIHAGRWDPELLELFGIPEAALPEVRPSCAFFGTSRRELLGGEVAVHGVAGDQQAALFGQACFERGRAKVTYGTGCFALLHTGRVPVRSRNRLLTTVAWDLGKGPEYALEGSVFIAGAAVQWLRDELGLIRSSAESESLARSVPDTGGVFVVPAFTGLGSPTWDADVRGAVFGLTRGSSRAHLARAVLESIAFQCRDLMVAMEQDMGEPVRALRADGGASANGLLMQLQADLAGLCLSVPEVAETTALGAAYLAGLGAGVWPGTAELESHWRERNRYEPSMEESRRTLMLQGWERAVRCARQFALRS